MLLLPTSLCIISNASTSSPSATAPPHCAGMASHCKSETVLPEAVRTKCSNSAEQVHSRTSHLRREEVQRCFSVRGNSPGRPSRPCGRSTGNVARLVRTGFPAAALSLRRRVRHPRCGEDTLHLGRLSPAFGETERTECSCAGHF